jgi:hypothetical protein
MPREFDIVGPHENCALSDDEGFNVLHNSAPRTLRDRKELPYMCAPRLRKKLGTGSNGYFDRGRKAASGTGPSGTVVSEGQPQQE